MCLLERRESTISPLNMTLAARLSLPTNSCVEVGLPINSWQAGVAKCPSCQHVFDIELRGCKNALPHAHSPSPHTPHCTVQPYWPHAVVCAPSSPVKLSPMHNEVRRLADTLRTLSLSGWYYGSLDWQGARCLLKDSSVGAFLIRNSGDSKFMFSLSVQTERGPTSVRLHFENGYFRLDCDKPLARYMPRFRCVVELVQHYTQVGQRGSAGTVWVDREGCPHSPILLRTPLRKSPPSLLHSARLAVHKAIDSNPLKPKLWCAPKHRLLPLPSTLIDYLGEYPYSI